MADQMKVLSLFAGIGGFDLGLERAGMKVVAQCEIDPFCRRVLAKHWPEVPCYDDVRTLTAERLAADGVGRIDVICGGFPCQDISVAGRQAGISAETRSGLWSEITRLVSELRPSFVIVENVANLLAGPSERPGGWFGRVLGDLAELGYDAEWENIPASAMGASHRRERAWLVAYPQCEGVLQYGFASAFSQALRNTGTVFRHGLPGGGQKETRHLGGDQTGGLVVSQSRFCALAGVDGTADGVPDRMDRVAALGNAVVPQIPEIIGRAILSACAEQRRLAA